MHHAGDSRSTISLAQRARRIYNALGFQKPYNFALWIVFAGGLMGFTLSRLPFLDYHGVFCGAAYARTDTLHASPGECWYLGRGGYEEAGMILHLAAVLPAALLACLQFTPAIRHRLPLVHRANGYLVLSLSLASTVGGLMVTRHAFGGGLDTQTYLGLMSVLFVVSLGLAYFNIKRLQVEQHRAWMLRAWFYAGSIITLRIVLRAASEIISLYPSYYVSLPCGMVDNAFLGMSQAVLAVYPECASYYNGTDVWIAVSANLRSGDPAEAAAALDGVFGAAGWLSLALHAIGVEVYLQLTPSEHDRLRNVSYQRQVEAGLRNPGRAGLTVDRIGDASAWSPGPGNGGQTGFGKAGSP